MLYHDHLEKVGHGWTGLMLTDQNGPQG